MTGQVPTFGGRRWRPLDPERRATIPPSAQSVVNLADTWETDDLLDPDRVLIGIWPHFARERSPHYLMNVPRFRTGKADVHVAVRETEDIDIPVYVDEIDGTEFTIAMAQ